MKYFSEITNKVYDTPEALQTAELAVKEAEEKEKVKKEKAAAERKERAAAVDAARKEMVAAQKKYKDALEDFCNRYGSYHTTLNVSEIPTLFDRFFNLF